MFIDGTTSSHNSICTTSSKAEQFYRKTTKKGIIGNVVYAPS